MVMEAMGENVEFEDWEAEETLSLCDLPIHDGAEETPAERWDDFTKDDGRRSPSDHEFFEFFTNPSVEISPAENIIFCGKLITYKENESITVHPSPKNIIVEDCNRNFKKESFFRRRSESLNEQKNPRSSMKGRLVRNSYSLDYRKLKRDSSSKTASPTRVPATRRASMSSPPSKSRWHLFMFGLVRLPPEMQLKDIRNRQTRRNPSSIFPTFVGEQTQSVKREKAKGSWRALREALNCKGHAMAAVTAALGCISYVRFARV